MKELEQALGYNFKNRAILLTALTHSSYANERRGSAEYNERLEFLGDSILGYIAAEELFGKKPKLPEGKMTKLRSELVCEKSLYKTAVEISLGKYLRLGRGEEASGGRERPSVLADAVEAVIAAMYLDGGIDAPRGFVKKYILSRGADTSSKDYKTRLQELIQQESKNVLEYIKISESGPDHDKTFVSEVIINGVPSGRGEGRTKKASEQAAAAAALSVMADG